MATLIDSGSLLVDADGPGTLWVPGGPGVYAAHIMSQGFFGAGTITYWVGTEPPWSTLTDEVDEGHSKFIDFGPWMAWADSGLGEESLSFSGAGITGETTVTWAVYKVADLEAP
jgi:hypothetical protein